MRLVLDDEGLTASQRQASQQLLDEALAAASEGLSLVRDRYGPQAIAFLASARLTNEENYLIQKLARGVVGTNSVHSCEAT